MHSVLENRSVPLREDVALKCDPQSVLNNAAKMEEGFIVAPAGNVPLTKDKRIDNLQNQTDD